jgi:HemY protein
VRSLVRVTRIDKPEAMLVAPEQAFFLRENLKLRLLNARLALLSRQFDIAQSDLRDAQSALDRYFDRSSRRVVLATELVRQVAGAGAPGQRAAARRHAGGHCRRRGRALSAAAADAAGAMRSIIWLVLLFVVAVVAATTLGSNDGLVTIYWAGWRTDLSLNLFVLLLLGACLLLFSAAQAIRSLLTLPERASEWRALRRERAAQAALREALPSTLAPAMAVPTRPRSGRWRMQRDSPVLQADGEFSVLARCWPPAACTACRTASGATRPAPGCSKSGRSGEHGVDDAARLLAPNGRWKTAMHRARWRCWPLPPAWRAARRPAPEAAGQPHGAPAAGSAAHGAPAGQAPGVFAAGGAGLLRSLAGETLDARTTCSSCSACGASSNPPTGVTRRWRRAPRCARCSWTRPTTRACGCAPSGTAWSNCARRPRAVALALLDARAGIGVDWLPRLECRAGLRPRSAVVAAVGMVYAERQLWGKARRLLEQAAAARPARACAAAPPGVQAGALAREEGDETAPRCERAAAALD